jgi:hypothetical protein
MQNLLRAVARAFAGLAELAYQWSDSADDWTPQEFAGLDVIGIDFSTSIQAVARHVIAGWDRYREQVETLKPDHGIQVFGVNSLPFLLTPRPVLPRSLPRFRLHQFQQRGVGAGLIEYGSAFFDYFLVALDHLRERGALEEGRISLPITVALLCDGCPNGGTYRAEDVRPRMEQARAAGVRFKLVGFAPRRYQPAMHEFQKSLGFSNEEVEVAWYDESTPDARTVHSGFYSLSHFE